MPLDRRLRDDLHRAAESIEPDTEGGLERVHQRAGSRSRASGALLAAAAAVVVILLVAVVLPGRRPEGSVPGAIDGTGSLGPTVRDATSILGSWAVTLTDADPGVASLGMAGEWSMRLGAGSTLELMPPAAFLPPSGRAPVGSVHAEDGDLFLTTLFARDYGASCTGSGTYTWAVGVDHLSLVAVDDTCDARRTLLATRPWTLTTSDPG